MNSVCLTGRLTHDLELKLTANNIPVCFFSIAVKRPNVKNTTDFISCEAWRNTAEFLYRYFKKGNMIAVTGCLTTQKYEKDGKKITRYSVVCDTVDFCESKQAAGDEQLPEDIKDYFEPADGENLPF